MLIEVRAGGYDPCVEGAVCTEVRGRPGVRTAEADGRTRVWTSSRDGTVVITGEPAGTVDVDTLAAAAQALAVVRG